MAITGNEYIPFEWCIIVLTASIVGLRAWIRRRMPFSWADGFIIASWVNFIAQASMDTALWRLGFFDNKVVYTTTDYGAEFGHLSEAANTSALKLLYVETCLYYTEMYCVKAAMLCFYNQLIPHSLKKLRIAMHITTGLVAVGWLSSVLLKMFLCQPMSTNWTAGLDYCDTNGSHISNTYEWAFHVLTDLCIYILPMFLLHRLQLPFAQKLGIGATFGVGLGCIVFANVFQVSVLRGDPYAVSWFYSVWEQMWALIVVCCPALKSLVNGRGFLKAIRGQQSITRKSSHIMISSSGISTKQRKGTLLSNDNPMRDLPSRGFDDKAAEEGKISNVTVSYEMDTKTTSAENKADDKSMTAVTTTAWSAY